MATTAGVEVEKMSFWQKVCRGEAGLLLNILFCLPVLVYKAFELLILPTAIVCFNRAVSCVHHGIWLPLCCAL